MSDFTPNAWNIAKKYTDDLKSSGDVVLTEQIGSPFGVAGLDANGDVVATPIHRADTATNLSAIILKSGEIALATDTKDLLLGDGVTAGGTRFSSQPVAYVGGPVELTSTTVASVTITHPMVAGGLYRIWGTIGFGGDTDNQSNFWFRMQHTSGASGRFPAISTFHLSAQWLNSNLPGLVTPTIQAFSPLATVQFPSLTMIHPTNNLNSGSAIFDSMLECNGAANFVAQMKLRVAKLGTPTIVGGYRVLIQRLK